VTGSAPIAVATAVVDRRESRLVAGLDAQDGVRVHRRCADVQEVLACASSGVVQAVVVSADLRGLDAEALDRLQQHGCGVVVLAEPGDHATTARLQRLAVALVLDADADPSDVAGAVRQAYATRPSRRAGVALADPRAALPGAAPTALDDAREVISSLQQPVPTGADQGRVVAVWGPVGAPGRTTVAVGLAAELAGSGRQTLLVDADTYGASVAQVLGLLDESAGIAGACRAADRGVLDAAELTRHTPYVAPRLRVLSGLVRPDRWPELRAGAVAEVLTTARALADWVVVDTGFCLEQDEELSYDTAAPRRNQATLTALAQADVVVAVGGADPIGLQRLVRGLRTLRELTLVGGDVVVVANRVRAGAVGGRPERRVREALQRFAGVDEPVLVPYDPDSLDAAVLAGRTLAEHVRSSPVRQSLQDVVARLHRGRVAGLSGAVAGGPVAASAH
jgi:MinD-like ATPase involved in chromosome partitioning or flagellar assembly